MLVADPGEVRRIETAGDAHQCRPQPAMDQRDLAVEETADEHVGRIANCRQNVVDETAAWMRPPVPGDGLAEDGFDEARRAPFRRREDDAFALDELEGIVALHGLGRALLLDPRIRDDLPPLRRLAL